MGDFADGYVLGVFSAESANTDGDELWTPPADWLEVPEPGPWEANFLVEINENNLNFEISFCDPKCCWTGCGTISINWGDGNITNASGGEIIENEDGSFEMDGSPSFSADIFKHTYEAAGQYVIKVTTNIYNCLLQYNSDKDQSSANCALLIAKLGENICLETDGTSSNKNYSGSFQMCKKLRWVSIKGNSKLPQFCFSNCNYIKRIDFINTLTEVPYACFRNCYSLNFKNYNFSNVTKIDTGAFNSCYILQKISAPLCDSVGNFAFDACYALGKAEFAENCTFGTNAFQNCYNLYPRPDGSTN